MTDTDWKEGVLERRTDYVWATFDGSTYRVMEDAFEALQKVPYRFVDTATSPPQNGSHNVAILKEV
jgi:hypothetical protein